MSKYGFVFVKIVFFMFLIACSNEKPEKLLNSEQVKKNEVQLKNLHDKEREKRTVFKVADVTTAENLLNETDYLKVVQTKIGKKILVIPREKLNSKLVPVEMNGFLGSVLNAYSQHRPLRISPDIIWLLIAQGVSIHINENHEKLKSKLFTNDKPVKIRIRNDDLVNLESTNWSNLISSFSKEIIKYTKKDIYKIMVPSFSTTGEIERTAFEITLLESVKKSFSLVAESGCGIPEIELIGKIEDWQLIYDSLDGLREFGLSDWTEQLKPIIYEFIQVYKGQVNKNFWNTIFKDYRAYNIYNISGWIIKFYPYVKKFYIVKDQETFKYIRNPYMNGEDYRLSNLSTEVFPQGYAKVPVQWEIYDLNKKPVKKKIEIYAGFVGIDQDKDTKYISASIGWAICEENATSPDHDAMVRNYPDENLKHDDELWVPDIVKEPKILPVYAPTINSTYVESIKYLQSYFVRKIAHLDKNIKVSFLVTWGGTISSVEIITPDVNEAIKEQIVKEFTTLPHNWISAKIDPPKDIMEKPKEGMLYKANYKIIMELLASENQR